MLWIKKTVEKSCPQDRKAETSRSEMRKLEAPTKRRFLPLPEEVKFPEFLDVEAGQVEKRKPLAQKRENWPT